MTRRLIWAAVSGIVMSAAFPPVHANLLAWICLVPFLLAIRDARPSDGFFAGLAMGGSFFLLSTYWIAGTIHRYGPFSLTAGIAALVLLVAVMSCYFGLFGAVIAKFRHSDAATRTLAYACAWVCVEYVRGKLFTGFPWALLGYSQVHHLHIIQIADMTAVYGVSFVIVVVNAAAAEFLAGLHQKPRRIVWSVAVTGIGILGLTLIYGAWRLDQMSRIGMKTMRVSIVQGNIEQDKKWDARFQDETMAAYERLTAKIVPDDPDLVIWPEAATPYFFLLERPQTERLLKFITTEKLTLLFGAPSVVDSSSTNLLYQNSAYLVGPEGAVMGRYDKMHLVPFGEYVPLRDALFFIHKLVDFVGDFIPGQDPVVMATEKGRVGVVICFEVVFPDLVRKFVARGAELMVTITNDAWFGRTGAPYEHFEMAILRAVENRVPLVRAANTGISGYIEATGRVHDTSPLFEEASLTSDVVLGVGQSLYTRYGDVFAVACVIMTVIFWINARRRIA